MSDQKSKVKNEKWWREREQRRNSEKKGEKKHEKDRESERKKNEMHKMLLQM